MKNKEIDKRICALAMAINRQTRDLADITSRRIRNVWVNDSGKVITVESAEMLKAKEDDDKKILDDMLRALEVLIKERDGDKVSGAVHDTSEGRDGVHSDAAETQ